MPFVGAPAIRESFTLSYALAAGGTLAAIQLLSLLVEPALFVLADGYPRKPFVCGGLAAMALACLIAAAAPGYAVLLAALALYGPASGCGVTLSQAALMEGHPEERERLMARWTLLGAAGDLAAPALFSLLALLALSWRAAFAVAAAGLLLHAIALWRRPFPQHGSRPASEGERVRIPEAIRGALGNRELLAWLAGVWLCGLLDEILVAFGSLHLRDRLGASVHERSLILMLCTAGSMVGLAIADRLLARVRPLRLLRACAAGGAAAYVAWVFAPSVAASSVLLFLTGLLCAPLYPIAMAQAYRALPGQPGMVNAMGHLFGPLDLLAPLLLGAVADSFGLAAALALLGAQPMGLLLISLRARSGAPYPASPPSTSSIP